MPAPPSPSSCSPSSTGSALLRIGRVGALLLTVSVGFGALPLAARGFFSVPSPSGPIAAAGGEGAGAGGGAVAPRLGLLAAILALTALLPLLTPTASAFECATPAGPPDALPAARWPAATLPLAPTASGAPAGQAADDPTPSYCKARETAPSASSPGTSLALLCALETLPDRPVCCSLAPLPAASMSPLPPRRLLLAEAPSTAGLETASLPLREEGTRLEEAEVTG